MTLVACYYCHHKWRVEVAMNTARCPSCHATFVFRHGAIIRTVTGPRCLACDLKVEDHAGHGKCPFDVTQWTNPIKWEYFPGNLLRLINGVGSK